MWVQLAGANPNTQDYAGMCLRFTQSVFGAPVKYRSAWDAWNATQFKHLDSSFPEGVASVVWFSHWGSYGSPPSYENWGHVVTRFPDGRYLSSPGSGYGQQWFNSIGDIERYFNAGFVGWSEDLNGLRIIEDRPDPIESFDNDMYAVAQFDDGWAGFWNMATGQTGHIDTVEEWQRITPGTKIYKFADAAAFSAWQKKYANVLPLNVDAQAIAEAVVAEFGNTEINVDAIAQAVADKIDCTCDCGCGIPVPDEITTKADILDAIETNYPEDK